MTVTSVSDASFQADVLAADVPVLVDFWAPWCGPCKQIAPYLDAIAVAQGGKLKIVKLDVGENPAVTQKYGVSSVPTLMIFKDGDVVAMKATALPKNELVKWISQSVPGL